MVAGREGRPVRWRTGGDVVVANGGAAKCEGELLQLVPVDVLLADEYLAVGCDHG